MNTQAKLIGGGEFSCPFCQKHKEQANEIGRMLLDVISQACEINGEFDSMALSDYEEAIRYLAQVGLLEIVHDYGRRVIARRKE